MPSDKSVFDAHVSGIPMTDEEMLTVMADVHYTSAYCAPTSCSCILTMESSRKETPVKHNTNRIITSSNNIVG